MNILLTDETSEKELRMTAPSQVTVLVVDDDETNISFLVEVLGNAYQVCVATDGEGALECVADSQPDLILLDIMMPGLDGYEVCRRLKASEKTRNIPVIFLTALTEAEEEFKGLELGAADYITKPFNSMLLRARVRNHLELKRHQDHLAELVMEKTRELTNTKEMTIDGLATLAEYRDPETGGHIQRTKHYVQILARALRRQTKYRAVLDDATIDLLYKSASLHDIGKVGVPDHILLKSGTLTSEEFEEMKKHTVYGANALRKIEQKLPNDSLLTIAREIAQTHHERWDGTGYPDGLKGEKIPLSGRLMAIADIYDALISRRVYKPPLPHGQAVEIIRNGNGRTKPHHFDPEVLTAFLDQKDTFRQIAIEHADSPEEKALLEKG